MKVINVEKKEKSTVELTIQVEAAEFEAVAACHIAHSSTEADGIGSNNALVGTLIGEDNRLILMHSLSEIECTEIHPCAATHLLVHCEVRYTSGVYHRIAGIGHTALYGAI